MIRSKLITWVFHFRSRCSISNFYNLVDNRFFTLSLLFFMKSTNMLWFCVLNHMIKHCIVIAVIVKTDLYIAIFFLRQRVKMLPSLVMWSKWKYYKLNNITLQYIIHMILGTSTTNKNIYLHQDSQNPTMYQL